MLGWLATLLTGNGLIAAACIGVLSVFITYDSSRVQTGRILEREQTQKQNRKASSASQRVRAKSKSRSVRGKRDPYTND